MFSNMKQVYIVMGSLACLSIVNLFVTTQISSDIYYYDYKIEEGMQYNKSLSNYSNFKACSDSKGYDHSSSSNISLSSNFYTYNYTCSPLPFHEYQWEISSVDFKILNPTVVFENTGGCLDLHNRFYPVGYKFEQDEVFTCSVKNNKYYWLIKKR